MSKAQELILAWALVLAPATVTAQVSDATRAKIVELQASDPTFRLKTFHRGCLDGSIQDPANCEKWLRDHIEIHQLKKEVNAKEAQVNAKEAQVNAKEAQLKIVSKVSFDLDIVLSLLYTANYIELNLPFPDWWETINKVLANPDTPKDVRDILTTFRARKDRWEKFDYNPDGKLILGTIWRHIDSANTWLQWLSDTTLHDKLQKNIGFAQAGYKETQRAFARKQS